jgi:hypothetical protein
MYNLIKAQDGRTPEQILYEHNAENIHDPLNYSYELDDSIVKHNKITYRRDEMALKRKLRIFLIFMACLTILIPVFA